MPDSGGAEAALDPGPVVIGGLRGSGTRVAAHLVRELGFYLGGNLNDALDDQSFGFLLGGRPDWYRAQRQQVPDALRLVARLVRGEADLTPAEENLIEEALEEWAGRLDSVGDGPGRAGAARESRLDLLRRRARLARDVSPMPVDAPGWGWKSPSAHVFVEDLAEAFPGMRYVHVVRDGADLVGKAKTWREVELWGPLLGLAGEDGEPRPDALLRYWRLANERVMGLAPGLFGERFMVFRYEGACSQPQDTVATVADFLGVEPRPGLADEFARHVSPGLRSARPRAGTPPAGPGLRR